MMHSVFSHPSQYGHRKIFDRVFSSPIQRLWTPRLSFASGSVGGWYDPAAAGLSPGGAVSLSVDQSGNGFDAIQATGASQPVYAIVPATGRRNLLLNSAFEGGVSGSPGTAPTSWNYFVSGTPNVTFADDTEASGKTMRIQFSALSRFQANQTFAVAANTAYTISIIVDVITVSAVTNHVAWSGAIPVGAIQTYAIDGITVPGGTLIPAGRHEVSATLSVAGTSGTVGARIGAGIQGNLPAADITIRQPQLDIGTKRTAYQRVTTQFDVTEAGVRSLPHFFNAGGKSLNATFPDLGSDATIAYASDQGVSILTGQTVGAGSFDILRNQRLFGMVVLDRALGSGEADSMSDYLTNLADAFV